MCIFHFYLGLVITYASCRSPPAVHSRASVEAFVDSLQGPAAALSTQQARCTTSSKGKTTWRLLLELVDVQWIRSLFRATGSFLLFSLVHTYWWYVSRQIIGKLFFSFNLCVKEEIFPDVLFSKIKVALAIQQPDKTVFWD